MCGERITYDVRLVGMNFCQCHFEFSSFYQILNHMLECYTFMSVVARTLVVLTMLICIVVRNGYIRFAFIASSKLKLGSFSS